MIDARTIQTFLKTAGFYSGEVDGIFGPVSFDAARRALKAADVNEGTWDNARTTIAINQLFLNLANGAQLIVDGVFGQKTSDAIYVYNTRLLHDIPGTQHWPRQADVRAGTSMFGKPESNLGQVVCPYLMYGDYKRTIKVTHFVAHRKIAPSLTRILQRTLDHYGPAQIKKLYLDIFSGCFNNRTVVGGKGTSMHAWAIAIDIDAAHNQMNEGASDASFAHAVYSPFIDFFEDEGWVSLGRARNYDWMHFQAARL